MPYSNSDKMNDIRQTCRTLRLDENQAEAMAADIRAGEELFEKNDSRITFDTTVLQRTQQHLRTELRRRRWSVRLQRIAAVVVLALVAAGIWQINQSTQSLPFDSGWHEEIPLWSFEVTRVNMVVQQIDPMALAEVAATFNDCWDEEESPSQSSGHRAGPLIT